MFSQKGNVTNVQLVLTVDGSSCYFALISYETEEEAKAALNYFDQSCVHSSRISIERCSEMSNYYKYFFYMTYYYYPQKVGKNWIFIIN